MTKRRDSHEESIKHETNGFQLELPPDINVEPTWKVQISANRIAMIYTVDESTTVGGVTVPSKAWAVYIVSKKDGSRSPNDRRYGGTGATTTLHSLSSLKHYLIDLAKEHSVKRTTRRVVAVENILEDDD